MDGYLGNRLRRWRTERDLTEKEVADLTGLSKSYISRLERNERTAAPLTRVKIARRLGVSVSDLFEVEELQVELEDVTA